tara:strand:+ start:214 stop:435 length:222 start_codon:yes stop_codon:yes gene_type:complete
MKASIHLFYGIIIGVLICACTGSIKSDKAEFEEEQFLSFGRDIEKEIKLVRKEGWTIIDIEVDDGKAYAHVGK